MSRPPSPRVSIEPLVAEYGHNVEALARDLGVTRRTIYRWMRDGIPVDDAYAVDGLAVQVGLNPIELWPNYDSVGTDDGRDSE